jgi:gamma-glutamylaminecyclotransferase
MILFVYGTLKRGERNQHRIADQRFVREAVTKPRYRVIDLGPQPGMIPDAENGLSVRGELWEVSGRCLEELDEFEGIPDPFDRMPIAVVDCADEVQAYLWVRSVPPGARTGDFWPFEVSSTSVDSVAQGDSSAEEGMR